MIYGYVSSIRIQSLRWTASVQWAVNQNEKKQQKNTQKTTKPKHQDGTTISFPFHFLITSFYLIDGEINVKITNMTNTSLLCGTEM